MDMETTTLITLAWDLHTQGLSKSCIAERLGKDRAAPHQRLKRKVPLRNFYGNIAA